MQRTRRPRAARLHRTDLAVVTPPDPKLLPMSARDGSEAPPILRARISVDYAAKPGVLRDFALDVRRGEILGLVGQSGSGKSTLALAVLRLLDRNKARVRGEIVFNGRDLMPLSEREMRSIRGREMALVLQNASSSLNPALRIGTLLHEVWRAHNRRRRRMLGGQTAANPDDHQFQFRVRRLFSEMSLPAEDAFLRRYPRELSTGQAQRVLIAMATLLGPSLLIADEPTSALDAITQTETLELFARLNREFGMTVLLISHDLVSVASLCDRIAILHDGQIVECGNPEAVFQQPQHPYAKQLIAALPKLPFPPNGRRR